MRKISGTMASINGAGGRYDVSEPSARSAETARVEKLVLFIGPGGEIIFNDQTVSLGELEAVMTSALPDVKEKTLVLKADRTVQHGTVVTVMDIAKRVGLTKLVVGTTLEENSE